jgi:hypothetical protein
MFAKDFGPVQGAPVQRWIQAGLGLAAMMMWASAQGQSSSPLAGTWRFQLDRDDVGMRTRWYEGRLERQIKLPGALQNQGFGDDISVNTEWTGVANLDAWLSDARYEKYRKPGNLKVPFGLQPLKHYVGAAWYQRDLEIPRGWKEKRVLLTLERPHWETRVWLDRVEKGTNSSLSTPQVYELGTGLEPGRHTLTIRVDNRLVENVGAWANSVSDQSQGNWNGIIGKIELTAGNPVWIEDAQVYPNIAKKSARVKVRLGNATGKSGSGTLKAGQVTLPVKWDEHGGIAETEITLGKSAVMWDEFHPVMQALDLELRAAGGHDERTIKYGLREIIVQGKQFAINGRKTFLRGTVDGCVFPLTGYPPTDAESWQKIMRTWREHGLNHVRFHSWCPPEAAFEAADALGVYLSVDLPAWTAVGDGKSIDDWLERETQKIQTAYGNHPSFILLTGGNEPSGKNREKWLAEWVGRWKEADKRRLYTGASGGPGVKENDYESAPLTFNFQGRSGAAFEFPAKSGQRNAPLIIHELGQWCAYPDFGQIPKYTGALKPKNLEIFRESLERHGMGAQDKEFAQASGKLQAVCYKAQIETALANRGVAGFQLLDLQDFPGQGTALVGILDAFRESKGCVTPEEFRRFCDATVILARMPKRVWTSNEKFSAEVEVAHYGPVPLVKAVAECEIVSEEGKVVFRGELPPKSLPAGERARVGQITADLDKLNAPGSFKVLVRLRGTPIENEWRIWIYPKGVVFSEHSQVTVCSMLDDKVLSRLASGGSVLLQAPELGAAHPKLSFGPVVWNRYMNPAQEAETLGLLCDARHPALAKFPTESFEDWQWMDVLAQGRAFALDGLPVQPIVQVIDDWNTNRKLGLIFECRVGHGKLLVCSADLSNDLDTRPAARQLRESLLSYMAGPKFEPAVSVRVGQLPDLLKPELR